MYRPRFLHELSDAERLFLRALTELRFGRFENIPVLGGSLVIEPWPQTIRTVKFECVSAPPRRSEDVDFELDAPTVNFFACVREIDKGLIRLLEVRHSSPFLAEIEQFAK